jgi:hypothetical protein
MASGRIVKAAIAGLGFCVVMAQTAWADSAKNDYVTVSASGASVEVDGNSFKVFAPGKDDDFISTVSVSAVDGWILVKPEASELPLKMGGVGMKSAGYEVECPPEDPGSGGIAFHNYYIKSNYDDGAKEIVVPAGAPTTYTAHKNGNYCPSNWTVTVSEGTATKSNTARIIFNRNWWDVPAWYVPAFDTPKAGVCTIKAHDVSHPILKDEGKMTVYGGRFTIYAIPPAGGNPLNVKYLGLEGTYYVDFDVGHTSWKLEVIPASAETYFTERNKEYPSIIKYLNTCVGYYPSKSLLNAAKPLGELKKTLLPERKNLMKFRSTN